ncbi:glycosyltransferase family 4 protein [Candidatus Woesearchaeota archaeon]|nr:glycosyltransferase family 4 protein [Candidatus Woesearchaeota archaeon]
MKVLMFGWEFPPQSTGGLGTACYGLTKALSRLGAEITLVLPTTEGTSSEFLKLIGANARVREIKTPMRPYMTSHQYSSMHGRSALYGHTLFEEVSRYADAAEKIAKEESFDVIHCHDWLTFEAGVRAKKVSGKPLVVHVHATEFDRTGGLSINQHVYDIERKGIHAADAVVAVSNYTKGKISSHYGISPEKVAVVHNAAERHWKEDARQPEQFGIKSHSKIVLFLGRITLQKGPDYFIYAAKRILELEPDTRFVITGSGDMEGFIINKAAELGIADKVLFTGFLKGDDVSRAYRMADVYVMPSVSEPFGITALEAINSGTPVIISRNAGVSEVISHCLKVDFWDINQLANKIIGVLRYKELAEELQANAEGETAKISWLNSAQKCLNIYSTLLNGSSHPDAGGAQTR